MTMRTLTVTFLLLSCVAVAYLLGRNNALQESLAEATKARPVNFAPTSVAADLGPISATLEVLSGEVVAIADGDTFTLLDSNKKQFKIRIQGIDAPEVGQDYSQESKQYLASLIFRKAVRIEYRKRDKYGRIVGKVYLGEQDIGQQMLSRGLAWFYRQYANEMSQSDQEAYSNQEESARTVKNGLWALAEPTPPWEYRHPSTAPTPAPSVIATPAPTPVPLRPQSTQNCIVIGNRNSGIYHVPGCASYSKVAPHNREYFCTEAEAERAGYRKARNC